MRFGTGDHVRRESIVSALRAHGARVVPGPVDGVCEVYLDTEDPLAAARRKLVAFLDDNVPGWRRDATIFCTADRTHGDA
ncbi:MAG: hypothetical protein QOI48_3196 [Solirubrobacteraceae bacterium]|jgi:hypothetical protein|nr:hypothetical protein [Solirubrobacteraceae bacterium]MEA2384725.1 hypothetical protein [Solirubrobacteraceae bacterium]